MIRKNLLVISLLLCLMSFSLLIARSAQAQKVMSYTFYRSLSSTMSDGIMEVVGQQVKSSCVYLPIILTDNDSSQQPIEQNVALCKPTRASGGNEASNAVDGSLNTYWSAQDFAPQWIEINLKFPTTISRIHLEIDQTPAGITVHRVFVKGSTGSYTLLHEFNDFTSDREPLSYIPPSPVKDIQFIKVETIQSPSWVAWYEIEVYALVSPP